MFRVIVAGSRDFNDYELLAAKLDHLLAAKIAAGEEVTIVSGRADGADRLGERYAGERGFRLVCYWAEWENIDAPGAVVRTNRAGYKYNARAGFLRNETMARNADALVAFWLHNSNGTGHMIDVAKSRGLPVRIVRP